MTGDVGKLYALSLFDLCIESGKTEEVYTQLKQCCRIFNENPQLVKLLDSPVILKEEKKDVISKIFGNSGILHDFICLVTEHNRITYFDKITDAFIQKYNQHNNIAEMTVITSVPIKEETKERLVKKLEEKSGKTINLNEKIDPDIIGGLILKMDNTQIDNSIRGRLDAVAEQLKIQ
jgi:F-type H+-transporting ATPase subunit delta